MSFKRPILLFSSNYMWPTAVGALVTDVEVLVGPRTGISKLIVAGCYVALGSVVTAICQIDCPSTVGNLKRN